MTHRPAPPPGNRACPYIPLDGGEPANPFIELGLLKYLAARQAGKRSDPVESSGAARGIDATSDLNPR